LLLAISTARQYRRVKQGELCMAKSRLAAFARLRKWIWGLVILQAILLGLVRAETRAVV